MPGIAVDVGELTRTCMLSVGKQILRKAPPLNRRAGVLQMAGMTDS
mgnify:CR=1 FL=1